MNLAEIQSFRAVGKHLRNERERRGLTLAALSVSSGLGIHDLVRIESGELLGFKQVAVDTLSHADKYAKALDVELEELNRPHSASTRIDHHEEDVYISVFLRKK